MTPLPRKVLVTGASRGIGLAIANHYREEKWEVLTPERKVLDLSSSESVEKYAGSGALDEIDVLVNNAGENKVCSLEELPWEDWDRLQNVNLGAPFLLLRHAARGMKQRKWGRIVNISSCYSMVTRAGRGAYTVTKSGLNGLTRIAAVEYGSSNILVNSVCPGFVDTDMTRRNNTPAQIEALSAQVPLNRLASPEEIAKFVHFIGSEHNTYITGQTIAIDGGFLCQ